MRIAWVQQNIEDALGPLALTEILAGQGHEIRFFFPESGWFSRLIAFGPEIVALSFASGFAEFAARIARAVKEHLPGPPWVVCGGAHPTYHPDFLMETGVDALCRGEAEIAFPLWVEGLSKGCFREDVPGFWTKRNGGLQKNEVGPLIRDLDRFPFPTRETLYRDVPLLRNMPFRRIVTGRGCPFSCKFCFNSAHRELVRGKGPYVRRRSVDHVLEELRFLKRRFGFRHLEFCDDIFTLDKNWLAEFTERYPREIGRPFMCQAHAKLMDEETAEMLAEAGCGIVLFGVESGSDRVRNLVLGKGLAEEDIVRCADLLHRRKLRFQTFNMMASPTETLEEAWETIRLNRRIRPWYAWCSLATPFPGTPLHEMCVREGLVEGDSGAGELVGRSAGNRSPLKNPRREELEVLQKMFAFLVAYPRLEPLLRPLLKMPHNPLLRLVFQGYYGYHAKARTRMSWAKALRLYLKVRQDY